MTLEDEATDIVHKAARGLGLAVPPHDTPDEIHAAAQTLGLNAKALLAIATGTYSPAPTPPDFLSVVTTPFSDMTVNAYRIGRVCFDTGADSAELLDPGEPEALFITHQHADHVADIKAFSDVETYQPHGTPLTGVFKTKEFDIEARPTPGHSTDGTTYVIHLSGKTIAIVGDALFAGSMGGPNISYQQCLQSARTQILSLPDDTILCPGHGPLTTVALEKASNPFFA